ncbi:MAG: low molecular weight protein arginine phosphatase [Anaerolineae bacterium]|nr:low molecular weight protein arginine phosphatase [Anaerolineae bacterium]MDW8098145.1 low molecular weight protein arginine phosphatase [Anaerolineae bacterium]
MKTLLFVCTGNLCRSPMAAELMRQRLAAAGLDSQVQVRSAGIWAMAGRPASEGTIQVMAERGIDLSQHRAHELDASDIAQADLILVMEEAHRRWIFHLAPQHLHKVFLLSEMAGKHHDIQDPYGQPLSEYRRCAEELDSLLNAGFPHILRRLRLAS